MFGLKIRSWMETHLVRSRKKRNKDGGAKIKQEKSPPDHIAVVNNEFEYKSAKCIDSNKKVSPVSTIKTQISTDQSSQHSSLKTQPFTCVVNLSSPESAYSTGYSTDGTSPGASLPPEYYINIRTGTHYFQSGRTGEKLTPRSARRKKDEAKRKKYGDGNGKYLPESSTEDEILNTDCNTDERLPSHRRTESCDETNLTIPSPPCSSPYLPSTSPPPPCSSPYLPGTSPRPRNRIRTNPWLPNSPGNPKDMSIVDTSSMSSASCREKHGVTGKKLGSPRKKMKEAGREVSSPLVNRRNKESAITTCSPLSARCPHVSLVSPPRGDSSSSPLSSSDDDHHGNTSDFSDDDVTLNEMLGKYDESYTYEKETDILSDSDLTDVDDEKHLSLEFLRRDLRDDFDFIDNGSSVAQSENNSPMPGKRMNTGHCYYHLMGERLAKQKSVDSRSSSRSSSVVKRARKSESERRRRSRNPSQEKLPPCHFKPCSPVLKNEKHLNINKILTERLNQSQDRGTQSANTTPLSARKRLTENGKYLKNDYITNLINSNLSLAEKNRNLNERKFSLQTTNSGSLEELQRGKRSNSLSQEIVTEPEDLKYKKLTEEANYIIEKLENCKINSGNRRSYSAQNSPIRSANISKTLLESHASPHHKRQVHKIQLKSDFESRNLVNQNIDPGGKCWSPLKVKLLQNPSNFDNRTNQNTNINSAAPVVKTMLHKKQSSSAADSLMCEVSDRSNKNFTRSLSNCVNNHEVDNQPVNESLDLKNNNSKSQETIGRSVYAIPFQQIDVSQAQDVMITLRDGNNSRKNRINENSNTVIATGSPLHRNYSGEPTYENINMKTFSRQSTPTKSPYLSSKAQRDPSLNITDPPKTPINTQTYKLTKSKFTPPSPLFSQHYSKPTLSTFHKRPSLSDSYHTRSTDILCDSKQKPSLPRNFKSLDLGPQGSDLYCPRSEPVKRKVYACSVTYGKLQKSLKGGNFLRDSETCNQLRNSVAQLRKERFYVEAKLRKAQQQINKIKNDF